MKRTLALLMANPRISDRGAAIQLKISQPTVSRQRAKLQKSRMLTYTAYPNLAELGYQIMTFTELGIEVESSEKIKMKADPSIVYLATMPDRTLVVAVHKNYAEYCQFKEKYPIINEQIAIPLSVTNTIKPLDFSHLIK